MASLEMNYEHMVFSVEPMQVYHRVGLPTHIYLETHDAAAVIEVLS